MSEQAWICASCAHPFARWIGRCSGCSAWGTVVARANAEIPPTVPISLVASHLMAATPMNLPESLAHQAANAEPELVDAVPITEIDLEDIEARYITNIEALDYVLGGGLVIGSRVLIGGEPGAGKSTLLVQAAAGAARWNELRVLYATGEESIAQVGMRAKRVGALYSRLLMVAETNPERIIELAEKHRVEIIIVDSISTMAKLDVAAAPGSVTQVRACAEMLCVYAKQTETTLVMIAHVTKDGVVAGPNMLKHLVDTVLHIDGLESSRYRTIRAHKNRNGDTSLRGEFEMTSKGLVSLATDSPAELKVELASPRGESEDPNFESEELPDELAIPCAHLYDNGACTMCGESAPSVVATA